LRFSQILWPVDLRLGLAIFRLGGFAGAFRFHRIIPPNVVVQSGSAGLVKLFQPFNRGLRLQRSIARFARSVQSPTSFPRPPKDGSACG
jgi:hypothetical protein